jgi:hypothetical protein
LLELSLTTKKTPIKSINHAVHLWINVLNIYCKISDKGSVIPQVTTCQLVTHSPSATPDQSMWTEHPI